MHRYRLTGFLEQIIDNIAVLEVVVSDSLLEKSSALVNAKTELVFLVIEEKWPFYIIENYYYDIILTAKEKKGFQKINLGNHRELGEIIGLTDEYIWISLEINYKLTKSAISKGRSTFSKIKLIEKLGSFILSANKIEVSENFANKLKDNRRTLENIINSNEDLKKLSLLLKVKKGNSNKDEQLKEYFSIIKKNIEILMDENTQKNSKNNAMKELLKLPGMGIINLSILLHSIGEKKYPIFSHDLYNLLIHIGYFQKQFSLNERYLGYRECVTDLINIYVQGASINSNSPNYSNISKEIRSFKLTDFL